jgi:excisionase family DNA binding protein
VTGPRDQLAGLVRTDVDQPTDLDQLDRDAAALADQLTPAAEPMAETAAAVAELRGYIAATAATATPGAVAGARVAVAMLDRATSDLVPVATVAARLGISDDLARHLVATGRLPSVRLGHRTIRVPAAALARLATTTGCTPAARAASAA